MAAALAVPVTLVALEVSPPATAPTLIGGGNAGTAGTADRSGKNVAVGIA
ncbi:hypothetical protein [Mycobacterium gastri]|nr:hypothetical protein [Mycobacterium gastri]ETW25482.1 hypothetical protein MGAST_02585 [Mycobacterium gastri 'Wayne']